MDRNALLAIVLCGILFVVYIVIMQTYYTPEKPPLEETAREEPLEPAEETLTEPKVVPPISPKVKVAKERPELAEKIALVSNIVLENDELRTIWTNQGAALVSATLKNQFKDPEEKIQLELLKSEQDAPLYLAMDMPDSKYPIEDLRYKVKENTTERIVFEAMLENGLKITKIVTIPPDKYHFDMDIILENSTDERIYTTYTIRAATGILIEGDPRYDMATVTRINVGRGKVYRKSPKDLEEPDTNTSEDISWAGVNNKYFAAVLKPDSNKYIDAVISEMGTAAEPSDMQKLAVTIKSSEIRLPPNGQIRHDYIYYIGPKKGEVLAEYGDLISLIDYGWTSAICRYLIKILNFFYTITHNYGVSILLLTLMVKSLLFPLTKKSQVSMYRMQKLQPEISKLKDKHKHNKQKMGQEQMALYKKHGVNPMGGCLPMVFQLPVFFALFRTLQLSFEMRHAPFVFWINDLSRPDTLALLPFTLPVIGNMINVLPIIMTIASFIQTRMTPKSSDPQQQAQQKMMAFMPLIFVFILYKMPSGLTLYWTTSTLLSIGEQFLIRRIVRKY